MCTLVILYNHWTPNWRNWDGSLQSKQTWPIMPETWMFSRLKKKHNWTTEGNTASCHLLLLKTHPTSKITSIEKLLQPFCEDTLPHPNYDLIFLFFITSCRYTLQNTALHSPNWGMDWLFFSVKKKKRYNTHGHLKRSLLPFLNLQFQNRNFYFLPSFPLLREFAHHRNHVPAFQQKGQSHDLQMIKSQLSKKPSMRHIFYNIQSYVTEKIKVT